MYIAILVQMVQSFLQKLLSVASERKTEHISSVTAAISAPSTICKIGKIWQVAKYFVCKITGCMVGLSRCVLSTRLWLIISHHCFNSNFLWNVTFYSTVFHKRNCKGLCSHLKHPRSFYEHGGQSCQAQRL